MALGLDAQAFRELVIALVLGAYVLAIVYGTRLLYEALRRRGTPHNVSVYYIRKIIHAAAGGVVAILTPFLFTQPHIPALMALALSGFLYYHRTRGNLLYWFQTHENAYEVNFTLAWGAGLWTLWMITGDPRLAVLPPLFIAFGDAVTGVVRNSLFARRTKHWIGNAAMALVTVPLGFMLAGLIGAIAGLVASIVERFEIPPIDDNVLIVVASTMIILLAV